MTEQELQAIEARLKAATPGPWQNNEWPLRVKAPRGIVVADVSATADAQLIANATADIAALVAEVRRLRRALADRPGDAVLDAQRAASPWVR